MIKNTLFNVLAAAAIAMTVSCGGGDSVDPNQGAEALNENIILPPGSFQVDNEDLQEDNGIQVTSSDTNSPTRVASGDLINPNISFTSANGDVTHAGIRFGATGKTWLIPIGGASGNNSGTLSFSMGIPSGLCDQIGQICHDVKCYEFAVASDGGTSYRISAENINELVLGCGACDDPSCSDLAVGCNCDQQFITERVTQLQLDAQNLQTTAQICNWFYNDWVPLVRDMASCLDTWGLSAAEQQQFQQSIDQITDTYDDFCN